VLCAIGLPFGLQAEDSAAQGTRKFSSEVITVVPLQILNSEWHLEVMVNGQGPFLFGTDTGDSGDASVTKALVERLQLPAAEGLKVDVSDSTGINPQVAGGARIETLTVGNVTFNQVFAIVLGEGPQKVGDRERYGTLGFDLFKDYVVTYDYPAKESRIATGQLPSPDDKTILSYTSERGAAHVPISIGRLRVEAFIDTGCPFAIVLPLSFADTLSLRAPPQHAGRIASLFNEFDLYRSELNGDIHIGDATLHDPVILFSDLAPVPRIGRDAFREFVVSFDQRHLRVQIQPSSEKNEAR
jgi:hypothetical protein